MGFKPFPIGVDNFKEMIQEGYYYVDKTLLIKELLDMRGKVFKAHIEISGDQYFTKNNEAGEFRLVLYTDEENDCRGIWQT